MHSMHFYKINRYKKINCKHSDVMLNQLKRYRIVYSSSRGLSTFKTMIIYTESLNIINKGENQMKWQKNAD